MDDDASHELTRMKRILASCPGERPVRGIDGKERVAVCPCPRHRLEAPMPDDGPIWIEALVERLLVETARRLRADADDTRRQYGMAGALGPPPPWKGLEESVQTRWLRQAEILLTNDNLL